MPHVLNGQQNTYRCMLKILMISIKLKSCLSVSHANNLPETASFDSSGA